MRTTCPFVEKFFVDVETYYYPDAGQQVHVNVKKKNVYSGQCAWNKTYSVHDGSSQTWHTKWTNIKHTNKQTDKQTLLIDLKIPMGRRHTSWLFTSMTEELN